MGYACPVCGDPQADARHLANHLAFTAMLGREDHEAWLDEHAPDWADDGERALAERVEGHAESVEYPQVFEDTTDRGRGDGERSGALFDDEEHGHDHGHTHDRGSGGTGERGHSTAFTTGDDLPYDRAAVGTPSDEVMDDVLAEARDLTREMLAAEEEDEERPADGGAGDDKSANDDGSNHRTTGDSERADDR